MSSVLKSIDFDIKRYKDELDKIQTKINNLERKKEKLLQLKDICPTCKGTGQERYTDAAGSGDWRECLTCLGLGKVEPLECLCGKTITVDMLRAYRKRECPWCGGRL